MPRLRASASPGYRRRAAAGRRFAEAREAIRPQPKQHAAAQGQPPPGRIREDAEKVGALFREPGSEPNLWNTLTELDEDYARVAKKAERSKQYAAAVSAIRERRSIAELKGRVRGELLPQPAAPGGDTYNILAGDVETACPVANMFKARHGHAELPPGPDDSETDA